ncbi:hypothetical protein HDC92_003858 [Pedobacter sp. AK017]|uniref:hypothetical protein n=1 Tax=Pedobacter sp. AK017 TaxID=2723073 RepID=UPI001607A4BB|nr:hypothetical protein [Pedobacter sp. AK017]MBB5440158.1 hypothetical protein [Pedobacter sp. AK017]
MDQQLDIKQQLAVWLAMPEKVSGEDVGLLKDLTSRYPYFQPLHLLLAKATLEGPEQNNNLATAALYTNGQLLYNLLYAPEELLQTDLQPVPFVDLAGIQPEPIDVDVIDEVPAESENKLSNADEQEVFEEIGEVNIKEFGQNDTPLKPEDDFVIENIVSSDFFAFQDNFTVEASEEESPTPVTEQQTAPLKQEEPVVISKYDDDQLPYTFLWWLAKTRKEHQQIFQPYASPKKKETEEPEQHNRQHRPSELQHQYVEHIFHIQSPFEEEEGYTTEGFRKPTKGAEIIESFIKNDPQISPPKPEQIDNENKAKKSAEDHNDLVSETLAKIYIEQMLYDKAIETYEKLSLKFPEKSRYFADLIQSIEKKI